MEQAAQNSNWILLAGGDDSDEECWADRIQQLRRHEQKLPAQEFRHVPVQAETFLEFDLVFVGNLPVQRQVERFKYREPLERPPRLACPIVLHDRRHLPVITDND